MKPVASAVDPPVHAGAHSARVVAFDYLRTYGVLLVVLHHTILAYSNFGFLNPYDPMATYSPVVDGAKSIVFDLLVRLNDSFMMPLLFLVSGLFVWSGLQRRGIKQYLLTRLKRLGIPCLFGVLIVPVAFYPTMLEIDLVFGVEKSFGAFYIDFIRGGFSQAGPLWFVWVLFAFDVLAATTYSISRRSGSADSERSRPLVDRPGLFAVALFVLSVVAYIPMTKAVDVSRWAGIGPFKVQVSRIFLYFVYFVAGVATGVQGFDRSAFRADGPVAKYWWVWVLLAFAAVFAVAFPFMTSLTLPLEPYVFLAETALVVMALIAIFLRFARKSMPVFSSLSANSYGIYIVHYAVIIWLQFAILRVELNAWLKAAIVFIGGIAICWCLVAGVRRVSAVRRIV